MSFHYDQTGVTPSSGFGPVPKGTYLLKIIRIEEKKSSKGDPQVIVDYEIQDTEYLGKKIRFHRVTFLGKDEEGKPREGAGIAIHFLKTIGEPWEGPVTIEPQRWIGKLLRAKVDVEEDFNRDLRNVVKFVNPVNPPAPLGHVTDGPVDEEGVPF